MSRAPRPGTVTACRICRGDLTPEPLFRLSGMPRAAQDLPDEAALAADAAIDLDVRQCLGCGLVQLANQAVPYHREVIRATAVSAEMRAFRAEQFGAFVRTYSLEGRPVLEIGCGRGEYLSILAEAGADAYGIEYGEASVRHGEASGLKVSRGFLEKGSGRVGGAPFDAFVMLNFLEHLPEPGATLMAIHDNLADGAVGIVEVPNFDMILERELFSEFISDHLTYFTRATLTTALDIHGFDVTSCRPAWHDYIISAVVRRRPVTDMSSFEGARERIGASIEAFLATVDGPHGGRVAAWGAGHQALTAIAAHGLADRLAYVVDSAPFKQGRYTPATHVRIVAPDTLETDPVDAVLVMAAAYSDEVVRTIRSRFGGALKVAVLRDAGLEAQP